MTSTASIVLLKGDGVGPEVIAEAKKVLDKISQRSNVTFVYKEELIGGAAIDSTGNKRSVNIRFASSSPHSGGL